MQKMEGRMLKQGERFGETGAGSRLRKKLKLNQKRRARLDTSLLVTDC